MDNMFTPCPQFQCCLEAGVSFDAVSQKSNQSRTCLVNIETGGARGGLGGVNISSIYGIPTPLKCAENVCIQTQPPSGDSYSLQGARTHIALLVFFWEREVGGSG